MQNAQAHALRRAGVIAAGLAATLLAHAAAVGGSGLRLMPIAPLVWLGLIAVAVMCGPRARAYAPRSVPGTFAVLITAQVAFHVVASLAPWALGIASSGMQMSGSGMFGIGALTPHVVAALLLGVLLVHADRAIARAVAIVRQIVAVRRTRQAWPRPSRRSPLRAALLRTQTVPDAHPARGPPPASGIALI
jgi:hypothetical protein